MSRVSGSFSYEIPPTVISDCPNPCGPFHGFHLTGYKYTSFVVDFGELTLVGSPFGGIGLGDSSNSGREDFFSVLDDGGYHPPTGFDYHTELRFDGSSDALNSTDIPSIPTLNALARRYPFYFEYEPDLNEGSTARYRNVKFSATPISPVPLPAGLPLIVGAVLATGWVSRRRAKDRAEAATI